MVLVFIGGKMMVSRWVHVNAALSLAVVVALLGGSIAFSLFKTRRLAEEVDRAERPADPRDAARD
jgi:tellurite resistance protein TerC